MAEKQVKIVQDPCGDHTIYFHVDVRLSKTNVWRPEGDRVSEKTKALFNEVLNIHGVQGVSVDRYKLQVERSKAVPWEEITTRVEHAILEATANGDLE